MLEQEIAKKEMVQFTFPIRKQLKIRMGSQQWHL